MSRAGIRSSGMPAAVRLSSHDVRREHIDRRFPHFHSADDDSSLACDKSRSVGTIRAGRPFGPDLRPFPTENEWPRLRPRLSGQSSTFHQAEQQALACGPSDIARARAAVVTILRSSRDPLGESVGETPEVNPPRDLQKTQRNAPKHVALKRGNAPLIGENRWRFFRRVSCHASWFFWLTFLSASCPARRRFEVVEVAWEVYLVVAPCVTYRGPQSACRCARARFLVL